jgi:hypothetical protein
LTDRAPRADCCPEGRWRMAYAHGWAGWHVRGNPAAGPLHRCPFCGAPLPGEAGASAAPSAPPAGSWRDRPPLF